MTDYLIGTGGWAYFKVPDKSSLKAYSDVFNFVEVNYTFYRYPHTRMVEQWRRTVPKDFTFAVRCHQDLTHRIGLKPVSEAYHVFNQMMTYCGILGAPFLVFETPRSYVLDQEKLGELRDFLSSLDLKNVRAVWEIRSPLTGQAAKVLQDLGIVHCVDLSREESSFGSDVLYTRLFGKGKHNVYQFTDEELVEIDKKVLKSEARVVAMSYNGIRMNTDAVRFLQYKETGEFLPATSYVGVDSVRAVLSEDARFPSSKRDLIEDQGWKVVDLTAEKRVHMSQLLVKIPERTYNDINDVVDSLSSLIG